MKHKIAVILCGCGSLDGSEIHEAVFTLASIDELDGQYECFAFDKEQKRVMNFVSKETEINEKRNQMKEAARISRGDIKNITSLKSELDNFSALIIPGGFGSAFNLCNFAEKGKNAEVETELKEIIERFYEQKKPICGICIAPAILALVLGKYKICITAGDDNSTTVNSFKELGCDVIPCEATECVVDREHRIVTTPAYMNAQRIYEVKTGIYKAVKELFAIL